MYDYEKYKVNNHIGWLITWQSYINMYIHRLYRSVCILSTHIFLTKQILGFCIKMCVYVKNKISKYIVIIFF